MGLTWGFDNVELQAAREAVHETSGGIAGVAVDQEHGGVDVAPGTRDSERRGQIRGHVDYNHTGMGARQT